MIKMKEKNQKIDARWISVWNLPGVLESESVKNHLNGWGMLSTTVTA